MALRIMRRTIQDSDAIKRLKTPAALARLPDSSHFSGIESDCGWAKSRQAAAALAKHRIVVTDDLASFLFCAMNSIF